MAYYYDWLERKWQPKQPRKSTPRQRLQTERRNALLGYLLTEISEGDSSVQLYAGLLASSLVSQDEELMCVFGREVAERVEHYPRVARL